MRYLPLWKIDNMDLWITIVHGQPFGKGVCMSENIDVDTYPVTFLENLYLEN